MMERTFILTQDYSSQIEEGNTGKGLRALWVNDSQPLPHTPSGPYYDKDGIFLGTDENNFNGEIHSTTLAAFQKHQQGQSYANSKGLRAERATRKLRKVQELSHEAQSKIYTHALKKFLNPTKLYNGKISIFSGYSVPTKSGKRRYKGYNDPDPAPRHGTTHPGGKIKITCRDGLYHKDLYTVEAIWNLLGVHEYTRHGLNGDTGDKKPGGTHWKASYRHYKHKSTYNLLPEHLKRR